MFGLRHSVRRGTYCVIYRIDDARNTVTVIVAAASYPRTPRVDDAIRGGDQPGVIRAGTRRDGDGVLRSSCGRVLSSTAIGATLADAREAAYRLVESIELPGGQHRTDIALKAVNGEISV
jgi:phosphoribosylamine--glycine ligase